jgi:lambda family phage portal protein
MSQARMAALDQAMKPQPPRSRARAFDGALISRLTASMTSYNIAIDAELRGDLDRLRARSRDMFKNNEYAAKFGRSVPREVVGPEGFQLQVRAKDPDGTFDAIANKTLQDAFWRWTMPANCDARGKRSFIDICRALLRALPRDGEYLVRRRRGNGAGEFSYQLQVLDVDRLDTLLNVMPAEGRNAIIMGVEVDEWGKPVAYHLWDRHPTESPSASRYRERVPANDIFHGFITIEDEQTRGVPWMHAALRRLNDLNGYREAAVIAARIGASKMGFFTSPDGQPPVATDGQDDKGNFVSEASPGTFDVLPEGYGFEAFNPDYPHAQFDAFCKATLRGVASAIGMSYHSLANDLEGINFTSIRSGTIEERDEWMVVQNWFIPQFLIPVYEDWLEMALLSNAVKLPNGTALPLAKKSKFMEHNWQARRWQWVDPLKDMAANVLAIENGLASPQQVCAQTGRDIEEVIDDLKHFQQMLTDKGVTLTGTTAPTGTIASAVAESGNDQGAAKPTNEAKK